MYITPVPDASTLKPSIAAGLASVSKKILKNTWREIELRINVLRATNGAHVETNE